MLSAETGIDFAFGTMTKPIDGEVVVDDLRVRATLQAEGSNVKVATIDAQNSPRDRQRFANSLLGFTEGTGWKMKLEFGRHHPRSQEVGWLRAGYLAAFSLFGFRYILRPQLDIVRSQIRSPEEMLLTRIQLIEPRNLKSDRWIGVVNDRSELYGAVVVRMGRHTVVLPSLSDDVDVMKAVHENPSGELKDVHIDGFFWPKGGPQHVLFRQLGEG
jgi:hypothetical protein